MKHKVHELVDTTRSCNTVLHNCIQWNLSIVNTIGAQLAVLYREVSLIQK